MLLLLQNWLRCAMPFIACGFSAAEERLASQVDQLIEAKALAAQSPLAGPVDDAGFLRRASLDFAGTIPAAAEVRAFIADTDPDKRAKLLQKLISAPEFAERMADVFNIQLMERRGDDGNWKRYLTESFAASKPWDQMVREILSPDFKEAKLRGAGYFITRRLEKEGQQETDYPGLTRDAGRFFTGVDLQCCQCHKHLTVKDYKQADFNGLFVAFQNVRLNEPSGDYKTRWVSEGLMQKKFAFTSVLNGVKGETGPRVPLGAEVDIPADAQWLTPPPNKDGSGIPKFSPLRELSAKLTSPDNPLFARNIANRIWWQLMGRGLVEPLDLHHSGNPPSHPELLDLLAKELTAHRFDLRWLIGELALTKTWQRSSVLPGDAKDPPHETFSVSIERPLSAAQLTRAFLTATGEYDRVVSGTGWDGIEGKRYKSADFEKAFSAAFAGAPKEPELTVNPTLKAALFLRNNELVLWCLQKRRGNLMDRVAALTDSAQVADELYPAILSRPPAEEEKSALGAYLTKHTEQRERTLGHYVWAMLSSIEFFTNH
ncbi:MAG TPA: DUF1553 domain-containing protein [Verrucomicrobiales bacterium]|nr:DUF1553 domain-containing protein [Verrucomicrobiales bacterium]